MRVKENNSNTSTMRHLCLLLLLLIITLALAQPTPLVDSRPLRPEVMKKTTKTDNNPDDQAVHHGRETVGGRVLAPDQVYRTSLASGPSRKGSGH